MSSSKTKIEWTDRRHNVFRGCTRVSPGCEKCYAERIAARFGSKVDNPYYGIAEFKNGKPRWTGKTEVLWNTFDHPRRWAEPSLVFVNTMSDTFHEDIPDEAIIKLFEELNEIDWHIYQILTKRPERMLQFYKEGKLPKKENFWYGLSVEDQARCDRLQVFSQMDAPVKWVSAEPLLEDISDEIRQHLDYIDWIVCGGESGPQARPMKPEWAWELYEVCQRKQVAYFFKQMGARIGKGSNELYYPYEIVPEHIDQETRERSRRPIENEYPINIDKWKLQKTLMDLKEVRNVFDACHDYLHNQAGQFPTWAQVRKAHAQRRLRIIDRQEDGSLEIVGINSCRLVFKIT